MNLIANNIANAQATRTPEGGAFRRQMAVFRGDQIRRGANPEHVGVRVARVMRDPSALKQVYDPNHPDANADGIVEYPNVDVSMEMVDLISAQRAYEANIAVIVAGGQMRQRAMEIIQR